MSICGICMGKIEDGEPYNEDNLSYDGCEDNDKQELWEYTHR